MSTTIKTKHFLDLPDIPVDELKSILKNAHSLKAQKYEPPQLLKGLTLAMIFDKRSTRTRVSFEVAMKQLGGHTVVMSMGDMQIGGAESVEDTAKVMARFVDAVMVRMSDHEVLSEFASYSYIPVINGLTDWSHPCQIMADLMTIEEKLGSVQGKKIAWMGDYNNVARTLAQAASIWDYEFHIAAPGSLHPANEGFGPAVSFTADPASAAKAADVIVTDTWVSMGQEGKSIAMFEPYQVNDDLMALANDDALFMHCMPIHQGEEVTDSVLKSKHSIIYDEAENRLHAQKAVLVWCLENAGVAI
ncbi:MAG: ornithine carbamoyltransferase [Rhodospirillales bacterium]|nr:ornithine carbamoyltransferase [Rhodospirillales bacterium]